MLVFYRIFLSILAPISTANLINENSIWQNEEIFKLSPLGPFKEVIIRYGNSLLRPTVYKK